MTGSRHSRAAHSAPHHVAESPQQACAAAHDALAMSSVCGMRSRVNALQATAQRASLARASLREPSWKAATVMSHLRPPRLLERAHTTRALTRCAAHPPKNSPPTYSCGKVGHEEYSFMPAQRSRSSSGAARGESRAAQRTAAQRLVLQDVHRLVRHSARVEHLHARVAEAALRAARGGARQHFASR